MRRSDASKRRMFWLQRTSPHITSCLARRPCEPAPSCSWRAKRAEIMAGANAGRSVDRSDTRLMWAAALPS